MNDIEERLRQGIDPADIVEAEEAMEKGADEIRRLRKLAQTVMGLTEGRDQLEAEIERLRAENADLRRWKALDKPLTAAMAIAQAEIERLRAENLVLAVTG
jgi:hypothetical protein